MVLVEEEIGLITPPVGMNLFVIRAQQPDIPITTLYRGRDAVTRRQRRDVRAAARDPRHRPLVTVPALRLIGQAAELPAHAPSQSQTARDRVTS